MQQSQQIASRKDATTQHHRCNRRPCVEQCVLVLASNGPSYAALQPPPAFITPPGAVSCVMCWHCSCSTVACNQTFSNLFRIYGGRSSGGPARLPELFLVSFLVHGSGGRSSGGPANQGPPPRRRKAEQKSIVYEADFVDDSEVGERQKLHTTALCMEHTFQIV